MQIGQIKLVSVAIPTKNRPSLLADAIRSVEQQYLPSWMRIEVVVIDNSIDGSAREICNEYGTLVHYFHCPIAGLSNARNRAVCESRGELIVFLDDDEVAEPTWLSELCEALVTTNADAAFGAVEPEFEIQRFELQEYAKRFYRRRIHAASGDDVTDQYYRLGTGNSCFVKARCFGIENPFLERFNTSGGEDIMLLKNLADSGNRFVWAPQACVREKIPAARCNLGYLVKRRFRNGQIRCWVLIEGSPTDKVWVVVLMVGGSVQILLGAIGAAAYSAMARSSHVKEQLIMIAAGAGKLLWFLRRKENGYI
jgi:succinoglycan biosynthesis protein ExoM